MDHGRSNSSLNRYTKQAFEQPKFYSDQAIDSRSTDLKLQIHLRTDKVISTAHLFALKQKDIHVTSMRENGVLVWRRTSGYDNQSAVENMSTGTHYRFHYISPENLYTSRLARTVNCIRVDPLKLRCCPWLDTYLLLA